MATWQKYGKLFLISKVPRSTPAESYMGNSSLKWYLSVCDVIWLMSCENHPIINFSQSKKEGMWIFNQCEGVWNGSFLLISGEKFAHKENLYAQLKNNQINKMKT